MLEAEAILGEVSDLLKDGRSFILATQQPTYIGKQSESIFFMKTICLTTSVADPGCLSLIPDPNFSIPDPGSRVKKIRIPDPNKIFFGFFNPKKLFLSSRKNSRMFILDPDPAFFSHPGSWIHHPGVKKACYMSCCLRLPYIYRTLRRCLSAGRYVQCLLRFTCTWVMYIVLSHKTFKFRIFRRIFLFKVYTFFV